MTSFLSKLGSNDVGITAHVDHIQQVELLAQPTLGTVFLTGSGSVIGRPEHVG